MITKEVIVDCKGRILNPKAVRDKAGLKPKSKVWIVVENGKLIISPKISQKQFINKMEGCIKEGTPAVDPLKLKGIWKGH